MAESFSWPIDVEVHDSTGDNAVSESVVCVRYEESVAMFGFIR